MEELKYIRAAEGDSPRDLALQRALDRFLAVMEDCGRPVAASRVRDGDDMYVVTKGVVLRRPVRADERAFGPGIVHPATDSSAVGLLNVPRFTMSRLISGGLVTLPGVPGPHELLLPVLAPPLGDPGVWRLNEGHGGTAEYVDRVPSDGLEGLCSGLYASPWWLNEALGADAEGMLTQLGVTGGGSVLMLMLSGDTMSAVVATRQLNLSDGIASVRMPDGCILTLDGWSEDLKAWSGLVRTGADEMRMRGNPLRKVSRRQLQRPVPETDGRLAVDESKDNETVKEKESMTYELASDDKSIEDAAIEAVGVSLADLPAQREELPAETQESETGSPADVVEDAPDTVDTAAQEPVQEPAPEEQPSQEEPHEETSTAQPKPRKRPSSGAQISLPAVTEWLTRPLPQFDATSLQDGIDEIRQLRELVIAASRRMTNISSEAFRVSKTAVDKVAAIQAVMGAR